MSKRLVAEAIVDDILKMNVMELLLNKTTNETFRERMILVVQNRLELEE